MSNPDDLLPKSSGIYKIQCLSTQQCYVGKAKNMYNRQCGHITCLNNDRHSNKRLVEVFEKYKREGLVFSVLEECLPEQLNLKELKWAYLLSPQLNLQWVEAFNYPYYSVKRSYFSEQLDLWLSWTTGEPIHSLPDSLSPETLSHYDLVGSFYISRQHRPPTSTNEEAMDVIEQWLWGK